MKQRLITHNGQTKNLKEWAKFYNINQNTLSVRMQRMSFEDAIKMGPAKKPSHISGVKICKDCKEEKEISYFYRLNRRKGNEFCSRCKECENKRTRKRRQTIREKTINLYSNGKNCCNNCGIDDIRVLAIDHINNDGAKDRADMINHEQWMVSLLENPRDDIQILCHNCNWLKHIS